MLYSEIHGDKTEMRVTFAPPYRLRVLLLLLFALALCVPVAFAQSTVIEPCPATPAPSPAKKEKKGSNSSAENAPKIISRASERLIDASIPDDAGVEQLLSPYTDKVRALNVVIGTLVGELEKRGVGANSLGNFVTDGMRAQASLKLGRPVILAITNAGGLRRNGLAPGEIRASDIFELLPFENSLIEVELTGAQVLKLLQVVTANRDPQSGARIQYRWNAEDKPEFISAKLVEANGHEQAIDPAATYKVVTIDYLVERVGGSYAILREGKNVTPLGQTLRDALMEYVKAATVAGRPVSAPLDGRFVQIGPAPTKPEGPAQ